MHYTQKNVHSHGCFTYQSTPWEDNFCLVISFSNIEVDAQRKTDLENSRSVCF